MVSRSQQSGSTIAVICQAALRNKRHNISSWFFMRVDDITKFVFRLKTAESIGSRFPVPKTRSTEFLSRRIICWISFSSSKEALQFILDLPQVEGSRRFVNGAEKVTSVFFGGKEVFADEGQGKQQDKKREIPKECKTCEGATSYKNIKAADGSGSNNKSTNTHDFTCKMLLASTHTPSFLEKKKR